LRDRKFLAVHTVGEQALRVPGIDHFNAVPLAFDALFVYRVKVRVEPKEHNVLRLREDSDEIQNVGKTDTSPLGNKGPTLFAGLMEDMALGGKPLQILEREK
jgi:hypothetical protein